MAFVFLGCKELTKEKITNPEEHLILQSIEKNGKAFIENELINSVSIGVYKEGETYTRHFGELDKGKGNQPNDNTRYSVASITKTMTAIIASKAVLEKKLGLDDDVRNYLGGDFPNLEYKGNPIKVRHLLTHMSGLPSDAKGIDKMYDENNYTMPYSKKDFFKDLKTEKIDTLPNTKYNYSNLATVLISYVLEDIYKKPFETMLSENIFQPADMTTTKLKLSNEESEELELGYTQNGEKATYVPLALTGADGFATSTIADLMKYIKFQLNEKNPLVKESHRKLYDGNWMMGYYWNIVNDGDNIYYFHFGNAPGTTTYFVIYPKYNMGISVISNMRKVNGLLFNELAQKLVDDIRPTGKSIYNAIKQKEFKSAEDIITFYKQLKKDKSDIYNFSSDYTLNSLGYDYLKEDKLKDAIKIFTLNTKEFPNSSNAFDSLGEAYFKDKNYELALMNYKKSLELDSQNSNAEKHIGIIEKM